MIDQLNRLSYRLKEYIKEQLVALPTAAARPATQVPPPQPQPASQPTSESDPGALLAGLL